MKDCVFCRIINHLEPAQIVYEDSLCLAFLDRAPQSRGQLQLAPKVHYRWIYEVAEMGQIFATAGKVIRAIIPVLGADHATLATFGHQVQHAHIWIVPQYKREGEVSEYKGSESERQEDLAEMIRQAIAKGV